MMKKVSLLSIFILALGVLLVTSTFDGYATETRVSSMGGIGYYIQDNSNVFYFPGTIVKFSNQVIAELRARNNNDLYTIGAHLPIEAYNAVFGVYLNQPLYLPEDIISSVASNLELNRAAAIFYGGKLTNYNYGVMFSIATDSWSDDANDVEEKESARFIGIGAGLSNEEFDLGVTVDLPSVSWELEDESKTWSGTGFGINGRYFTQRTNNMMFVPFGTLYFGSTTREYDSGIAGAEKDEIDYNKLNIGLGAALNYQISDNNLVVLAIEAYGLSKETSKVKDGNETTEKWTTLPGIYLGVESQIKPWLIGRMGAAQIYQHYTEELKPDQGDSEESTEYIDSFGLTFGLGCKFGNFLLDASFNEALLFDGPNFISGISNSITHKISITYLFE